MEMEAGWRSAGGGVLNSIHCDRKTTSKVNDGDNYAAPPPSPLEGGRSGSRAHLAPAADYGASSPSLSPQLHKAYRAAWPGQDGKGWIASTSGGSSATSKQRHGTVRVFRSVYRSGRWEWCEAVGSGGVRSYSPVLVDYIALAITSVASPWDSPWTAYWSGRCSAAQYLFLSTQRRGTHTQKHRSTEARWQTASYTQPSGRLRDWDWPVGRLCELFIPRGMKSEEMVCTM